MRLIDAAAEIERLESDFCKKCEKRKPYPIFGVGCCPCGIQDTVEILDNAPEIVAEPVMHGYWIIRGCDMWCSECGYGDVTEFGEPEDYRYCPNCGARMGER